MTMLYLCSSTADEHEELPTPSLHDQWQADVVERADAGYYTEPMDFGARGNHWLEPEVQRYLMAEAAHRVAGGGL